MALIFEVVDDLSSRSGRWGRKRSIQTFWYVLPSLPMFLPIPFLLVTGWRFGSLWWLDTVSRLRLPGYDVDRPNVLASNFEISLDVHLPPVAELRCVWLRGPSLGMAMRSGRILALGMVLTLGACQGETSPPDEGELSVAGASRSAEAFESAARKCGLSRFARRPAAVGEWRSVIFSTKDPRPLHCTVQWMLDHPELRLRMDR
ncbi:hypothetical protein [Caulobacter sp.]|uniref:hypothetical protein n=1 Tax=Caulobacter sp. TaxID=78 RepID=UPI001B0AD434|nr:hypothetical protein [Caulobacter sp.]MBO9545834.1 hypothetical protein [Caulobacter sp.]